MERIGPSVRDVIERAAEAMQLAAEGQPIRWCETCREETIEGRDGRCLWCSNPLAVTP